MQLHQLKALIEGMLADPRRGMAARASQRLGQAVQFDLAPEKRTPSLKMKMHSRSTKVEQEKSRPAPREVHAGLQAGGRSAVKAGQEASMTARVLGMPK